MPLASGSRLGSYEILAQLGRGGMGVVYRARDLTLGREVAIKVLGDDELPPGSTTTDLLREARHASSLSHPNICPIHHVGETDGRAFVVMELVRGRTLASLLPAGGLPLEQVLRYGLQLVAGVAHAHERRIVHRDLKCANVMVSGTGRVHILDFGLATRLPGPSDDEVTRSHDSLRETGGPAGTLPYLPPEVLAGEPATPASDVWALGVVLYEMCSGRRPFAATTTLDLITAIARDTPSPLPDRVPAPLRALIVRCLAKDPSERYQTASEMHAALEVVASVATGGVLATTPGPVRARRRSRSLVYVAAAGAAAAAIAALVFFWPSGRADSVTSHQIVSTFPGAHRSGSLSPDGSSLAFVQPDAVGVPQVWVKNLAQGAPVQITSGDQPVARPRWAASGDRVVFARRGAGIWSVSPFGGAPRQIVSYGSNPDVAADGRTIVFEQDRGLWVVRDDGSEPAQIGGFPERVYSWPYTPAISPDAKFVAFFRAELGPNGDFWVVPVGGGTARRLTSDLREGGSPTWSSDGASIIVSSARRGSRTLWRIPIAGGEPEPVTSGAGEDLEPDLSADGTRVLYTNVRSTWRLHQRDLSTGAQRVVIERREPILWPRFSPDGGNLAFFAPAATSAGQIYVMLRDGTNLRQLTDGPGEINTMPRWSSDGLAVLFYQMAPGRSVRQVAADGGVSRDVIQLDWDRAPGVVVDPAGVRFAYFSRERQAGVVRHLTTGDERTLPVAIEAPRWSPDGREVAGHREAANGRPRTLVICPADGRACRDLVPGEQPVWSPDGTRLYFLRPGASRAFRELWSLDLATGAERSETTLGPMRVIDVTFDVSARGELVWAEFASEEPELWMVTLQRPSGG
jgi:serine/threonine protein kinase